MPERIQRKRTKGWRMPPNTVYVGRPTMWGNYQADGSHPAYAVACFRSWVEKHASSAWVGRAAIDLRGKNLACWCDLDKPCHADVLLELANGSVKPRAIDVKWLRCDFDGCRRQENGDCSHCGFHAGEMDLLRRIGQGSEADAILAKYTERR